MKEDFFLARQSGNHLEKVIEAFGSIDAASPQSSPAPANVDIVPLVIADLEKRAVLGLVEYGTPLQAHNGRNALIDLYQELLDACCYLRQYLTETA